MTTLTRRVLDLATLTLAKGAHNPDHTFCVMEAAAYVAGEPWSDSPACVSPSIAAFLRNWNDAVDDTFRQRLKPYIGRVLDTRTTEEDETIRAWLATDWLVRVHTPAWLDLAGLTERAGELRNLLPLRSRQIAVAVQAIIEKARAESAAAWAAAGAAAWAAAWDAAWDAAGDAAWAAAWDAARAAAGDAAEKYLAPTVTLLQESAFDLLDRMIAVGRSPSADP
jgi:hypothetical protein